MRLGAAVAIGGVLLCACGAEKGLKQLENTFQVVGGGLDPSLLGTYRIDDPALEHPWMLRLLVLRDDGSFHGELVTSCDTRPCAAAPIDGVYTQFRELQAVGRAAGVSLTVVAPGAPADAGEEVAFRMHLRRALVADSPQVSLYHEAAVSPDGIALPFFQLVHPFELWCGFEADCGAQELQPSCAWACRQARCECR